MTSKSTELFERAQKVLPGGVSRNTLLRGGHPIYVSHAYGATVVDVDGVERLDFANNMASHIHGHAFPPIVDAVTAQLKKGSAFQEDQKNDSQHITTAIGYMVDQEWPVNKSVFITGIR